MEKYREKIYEIKNGYGLPKNFYEDGFNLIEEKKEKLNGNYKLYYDNGNLKFEI